MTLKIDINGARVESTLGERVLRIEVVVHNTTQLRCGRSLGKFPDIVVQAKSILEQFMDALSCIDPCFIADRMLTQLPAASQIGNTKATQVRRSLGKQCESEYGPRRASYDLKKLRGKQIVRRIGKTRRYESIPKGLRAIAALVVLRNKAIKPLLAAAEELRPSRGAQNPSALDEHYETIRVAMQGIFQELDMAA